MKTVFDNREVAHFFNADSATQPMARSDNLNFNRYDSGIAIIRSYTKEIAVLYSKYNAVLMSDRDYSVTTAKHKSYVRRACSNRQVFEVPNISIGKDTHRDNLKFYRDQIAARVAYANKPRVNVAKAMSDAATWCADANRYAEAFGLKTRLTVPTTDEVRAMVKRDEAKEKRRLAAAAAKQRAAEEAAIVRANERADKWIAGESVELIGWADQMAVSHKLGHGDTFTDCLRIVGDQVETTGGASVPLAHVRRAMPIILRAVRAGVEWTSPPEKAIHLGAFTLDRIDAGGTVSVGCHTFIRAEIERFAAIVAALPVESSPIASDAHPGMIRCNVTREVADCLAVTFPDHPGKSMLIQAESDRRAFIDDCGSTDDADPTDIEWCPDEYLSAAVNDEAPATV